MKKFRNVSEKLKEAGWALDPSFREVPAAGLHRKLWTPKLWGKWKHEDNILIF